MKYIQLILLFISIIFASCESMNDTYSDIIKKQNDRYIGKCNDIFTERGWNRIKISWTNSVDPTITRIKVKWSTTKTIDSVYLDKDAVEFTTPANLTQNNYKISVCAVDDKNRESLPITTYCEPFSEEDELINSLKVIEKKYFIIDNKLILLLHKGNDNIMSALISYNEGESYTITKDDFKNQLITIDEIDKNKPISISVTMQINGCIDDVKFKPYKLKPNLLSLSSDFIKVLGHNRTYEEIDEALIESIETLDINCSMSSLEDLLFFPNLKKIVMGNKKFLSVENQSKSEYLFDLKERNLSIQILKLLQNKKGLVVEVYGNNFDLKNIEGLEIVDKPFATLPELPLFTLEQMTNWGISSNYPIDDLLEWANLFDNNSNTYWKPIETDKYVRKHQLVIDMGEIKNLHGILFSQIKVSSSKYSKYMPNVIKVALSADKENWTFPFNTHEIDLGYSSDEKTLVEFNETRQARYIILEVSDNPTSRNNYVLIGDFIPY